MHFHVLGLGAVGSLVAHHLRRALPPAHTVTLIHKTPSQAQVALSRGSRILVENDGVLTSASGFRSEVFEASSPHSAVGSSDSQTKANGHKPDTIHSLFVTTKAHQTVPAINRLLPRISENSTIVLLQNGMGIYEELMHRVFRNPSRRPHFILASNTHGAFLKGFYHVCHAGIGGINFGIVPDPNGRDYEAGLHDETLPEHDRAPRLTDIIPHGEDPANSRYTSLRNTVAALLVMEPLSVSWNSIAQVELAMRRKLVVNSVINPLTALMGCRNGDIFGTPWAERIMRRVCQEASDVFAAQMRAETQSWLASLPQEQLEGGKIGVGHLPPGLTRTSLEEEVQRVAALTKGNISSMLSDVRRGRKTEIEFLNGYLLRLGTTYRVEMPATATLYNLVNMRSAIPLDQVL